MTTTLVYRAHTRKIDHAPLCDNLGCSSGLAAVTVSFSPSFLLAPPGTLGETVEMASSSIWSSEIKQHPSCRVSNPHMRTNVLQSNPSLIDPTSIVANPSVQPLGSGCWYRDTAQTSQPCTFKINRESPNSLKELTVDMAIGAGCSNTWAAPLWLDPVPYGGGKSGYSGEIDVFEICGNKPDQNYAGWGVQLPWSGIDLSKISGPHRFHVHYDKDADAVTTWACPLDVMGVSGTEDKSRCFGGGNFKDFSKTVGNPDKMFHLVSSLWNPAPNLAQGGNTCGNSISPNSTCSFSVENIRLETQSGQPMFPDGKSVCAHLNAYSAK